MGPAAAGPLRDVDGNCFPTCWFHMACEKFYNLFIGEVPQKTCDLDRIYDIWRAILHQLLAQITRLLGADLRKSPSL